MQGNGFVIRVWGWDSVVPSWVSQAGLPQVMLDGKPASVFSTWKDASKYVYFLKDGEAKKVVILHQSATRAPKQY